MQPSNVGVIVDCFISDPVEVDWDIFFFWCQGFQSDYALRCLGQQFQNTAKQPAYQTLTDYFHSAFQSHVISQYQLFDHLSPYLSKPFAHPFPNIQLDQTILKELITKFYAYDHSVMRHIVGHKIKTLRVDPQLQSELDAIPIRSLQRQLSNLKNIAEFYKTKNSPPLDQFKLMVSKMFILDEGLAHFYSMMLFLEGFDLSHKTVMHLNLEDLIHMGESLWEHWTNNQAEISKSLLVSLRKLAPRLNDKKNLANYKRLVIEVMFQRKELEKEENRRGKWGITFHRDEKEALANRFQSVIKPLRKIASKLTTKAELRDLFIDIQKDIVDPFLVKNRNHADVEEFLSALLTLPECLEGESDSWRTFLKGVIPNLMRMHHRSVNSQHH